MKKQISFFLTAVLLISLCGCTKAQEILFYYPRSEIQYGATDGVISAEARDFSSSQKDLTYLLKLYLEGPTSQELYSPFPKGTALVSFTQNDGTIEIILSEPFSQLENLDYTIACASIASTCFSLTDGDTVTIQAGEKELTLTRDNLTLWDQSATS